MTFRRFVLNFFVIVVSLSFSSGALAAVHFVDSSDPTCGGRSPCYSTIQGAVDAVGPGDTVQISTGIYAEQVRIKKVNFGAAAVESDRVVIEADPAAASGSVVVNPGTVECSDGPAIRIQQSNFVTVRGLTITGTAGRAIVLKKTPKQSTGIHLESNRIFGNGGTSCNGGIVVRDGNEDAVIANNLIYGNGRNGIVLRGPTGGNHAVIGNTVYANGRNGVRPDPELTVLIANNVLLRNGTDTTSGHRGYGVRVPNSAWLTPENIQLSNNLICGNHRGELRRPERILDSVDVNNLTPTGTEGQGVAASPLCNEPAVVFEMLGTGSSLDFTLSLISPALDSGATPQFLSVPSTVVPIVESDQTGTATRPQDGDGNGTAEFDRGALERGAGATGTPPSVAITSPLTGITINVSPINVTGTVDNADAVVVNGVQATIVGSTFTVDVPLIEGQNAIIAVASNVDGCAESEILVTLDSPPLVTILAPTDGLQTSATQIEISGTATDLVGVQSVAVNGQPATLVGDDFSVTLPLVDGDNLFTTVATDTIGNIGSSNVSVFRADAPTITIDSFSDGEVTSSLAATVSGLAAGTDLTVFVDNVIAVVDQNGIYTSDVQLVEGVNAIEARAESPFGIASLTINLTLDTIAPLLTIESPSDGFVTTLNATLVSGTTTDVSAISSVDVNGVVAAVSGTAWSVSVPLADGNNSIVATATDAGGNAGVASIQVTRALEPLVINISDPSDGLSTSDSTIVVSGFISDASASVSVNGVSAAISGTSYSAQIPLGILTNTVTAVATRGADSAQAEILVIRSTVSPPDPGPDPETVASPSDPTVATSLADSVTFLYEGVDPIQTVPDTAVFVSKRVSVVRGRVLNRFGLGLAGTTIGILNRPEFGTTVSRADGGYDLAVNGGGTYVVDLRYPGFIPSQRQVNVPWREFAIVDDVVLLALDAQSTAIDFANPPSAIQIARGSVATDEDGSRQATVFFPAGTTATMRLPDGSTQPLTAGTVRLTEFTVGDLGPNAMPGALPPTSGYTYAVDLCIDEAFVAGAVGVDFDEPVSFYVENFVGFPVGEIVPFGYYDFEVAAWVPSDNGLVIRIASIDAGLATVEPAMALSDDERSALASIYQVGDELWRVPVPHFSEGDLNWPRGFPVDADGPPFTGLDVPVGELAGTPSCADGSIIECETQILGETIPLVGTPFDLNYRSDRVPGRAAKRTIRIPITTNSPPAPLRRVDITVDVAGQRHELTFPPTAGQEPVSFTWDGKDAYGRDVNGSTVGRVKIGYVYEAEYQPASAIGRSFARPSDTQISFSGAPSRAEAAALRELKVSLGAVDARGFGVGGWTLSPHHFYDPDSQTLYRGDGAKRNTFGVNRVIDHFAGVGGSINVSGVPGPATEATFGSIRDIDVAPDGTIYLIQDNGNRLFSIDPDTGLMDNVSNPSSPSSLAIGSDGSIFVVTGFSANQIQKIDPDGGASNFAGAAVPGAPCFELGNGEGELATAVSLCQIRNLVAAPDGSLYFTDGGTNSLGAFATRLRRVTPDGRIETILGEGSLSVAGIPAAQWTSSVAIGAVTIDEAGTLYFISGSLVYRVRSEDSILEIVAGGGNPPDGIGDGLLATEAIIRPGGLLQSSADGGIFVTTRAGGSGSLITNQIRHFVPGGIIRTIAGNGETGFGGNGQPATRAPFGQILSALAEGPDGTVYLAEQSNFFPFISQIRTIRSSIPDRSDADVTIPSEDGRDLFDFDSDGRHLRTRHALTDADLLTFGYDADGLLVEIREIAPSGDPLDDLVMTVIRDVDGLPVQITGPFGAVTNLTTDSNGYLDSVANPIGDTHTLAYSTDGLLESYIRPAGGEFQFSYDSLGLLMRDDDPEGGFQTLARLDDDDGYTVTLTSPSGLTRVKRVEDNLAAGGMQRRTITNAAGFATDIVEIPGEMTVSIDPTGTRTETLLGPDPRFGLSRPIVEERIVALPSGLTRTDSTSRVVTVDPLTKALLTQQDTIIVNGRSSIVDFDVATLTRQIVTPVGRVITQRQDSQGRTIGTQIGSLEELRFEYDDLGQAIAIRQGQGVDERVTTITRDSAGNVDSLSNFLAGSPLISQFAYDGANRLVMQTSPGLAITEFNYDANGNLTGLTPDGRPDHVMAYSTLDLEEEYAPPAVSGADPRTFTTYDLDRRPTLETRPDGSSIAFGYDLLGRLSSLTIPRGTTTFGYSASTGQLNTIDAPGGESLSYGFDGSLLTSVVWSGSVGGSVSYSYDSDFRVASELVSGSAGVGFVYDDDSLLTGVGAMAIGRDLVNGLVTSTVLDQVVTEPFYDSFGSLESTITRIGSTPIYSTTYVRDTFDRIVQKSEVVGGVNLEIAYGYDLDGRLESVTENNVLVRTYSYDGNGNRLTLIESIGTVAGTYDVQDRLTGYGDLSFSYDEAGDLQSRTTLSSGATDTFNYDALGNLMQVNLADGRVLDYVIDGQSRRVGKRVDGVLTRGYLYSGQLNPVAELDGLGNLVSRFVYGAKGNVPAYMVRGGTTYRIVSDHLGSVRLVVDASNGSVVQRMDYDEFGNVLTDTNSGFQPFGFAGGIYDEDTRLIRFGARDYDPIVGRWTTKDPIRFGGGVNLYTYALNDPANVIDPDGLFGITLPTPASLIRSFIMRALGADPLTNGDEDTDGDGTPDFLDPFPLEPSLDGSEEPGPPAPPTPPTFFPDSDGDGVPDVIDPDSDNFGDTTPTMPSDQSCPPLN